MAFDEDVLLDQDRFLSAVLLRPEFQKTMTGTELRNRLGELYAEQERKTGVQPGLLATCHRLAIPIFVGAPADGSVFLNSMKLWAMRQAGIGRLLQFRSRPSRRGVRSMRVSSLGTLRESAECAGHPDARRRRAEKLQPSAGARAGADPGHPECPGVQFRCTDRDRARNRRLAVIVPAGPKP